MPSALHLRSSMAFLLLLYPCFDPSAQPRQIGTALLEQKCLLGLEFLGRTEKYRFGFVQRAVDQVPRSGKPGGKAPDEQGAGNQNLPPVGDRPHQLFSRWNFSSLLPTRR